MKHKITLLFLLFLFSVTKQSFSQIEAIGSEEYGRIFNITYDPNIENQLYAISLYNHILISHDNGDNWEVLFSLPVNQVTKFKQLKMAQNNTALSFIKYNQSSSDNTLLIFDLNSNTIIDEIEIPYNTTDRYIQSYSMSPSNSDIILMNTELSYNTLENTYYTIDGGQNWDLVYTKSENDDVAINQVYIDPIDPQHLFLARGLGPSGVDGGLFVSNDAGQSWTEKLTGVPLYSLIFNPQNNDEIYVGSGISFGSAAENLYKSIDGGENWQSVPITWTAENLDNITYIAINPLDANHIIVLEENEIVISTDNGATWENYVYDTNDVHGYYYGNHLSFNPFNFGELFIESDYHPLFSSDGGVTVNWSKNNYFTSTGSLVLNQNGDGHLYYGVQYGYVYRDLSTNNETTFDINPLGWYSQSDAPTLFADKFVTGRLYHFASGWFGSDLEVSFDHGQTKYQMFNTWMNFVDAIATDPLNSDVVWVSLSNTVGGFELKSVDISDINNIVSSNISLPDSGKIKGIHFDPINQGHVLITIGTNVYKTTDYGVTWTLSNNGLELLNPSYDLIASIDSNPLNTNQLTIATNRGVFTSLDGGDSWNQLYSEPVHQVYHSTFTNGHLVGIIHTSRVSSFEIIYSNDSGQNWNKITNQELLHTGGTAGAVRFSQNSAEVYIGSTDLGLLKYTVNLNALDVETPTFIERSVNVFPNPTRDFVTVLIGDKQPENIKVYNLTGLKVIEVSNTSILDFSQLQSGAYLLQITDETGNSRTKKLFKQ